MAQRDTRLRARWVGEAVAALPERERIIVCARFFNDEAVTLERLGTTLGISKERVRQLEHQALKRLRRRLGDIADLQRDFGTQPG